MQSMMQNPEMMNVMMDQNMMGSGMMMGLGKAMMTGSGLSFVNPFYFL